MSDVHEITSVGEWLRLRRQDITASRVAALFGAHPFLSLDDLVADMRGQSIKGDTPSMRAGRLLEAVFPAAVAEERPEWNLVRATTYHRLPDLRLGATPDFWIGDDGLMETKTINEREWERAQARPPLYWSLQALVQLIVTGRAWGALGVIVRSSSLPLHLFDIARHPAAEAKILAAVADFWSRADAGELPIAAPRDELEALLDDGSHRDLSGDNALPEILDEREELVATRGGAEKRIKELDYEIKNRMGTASSAYLPGWAISWRAVHRKAYSVAETDIRVLRIRRTADD